MSHGLQLFITHLSAEQLKALAYVAPNTLYQRFTEAVGLTTFLRKLVYSQTTTRHNNPDHHLYWFLKLLGTKMKGNR